MKFNQQTRQDRIALRKLDRMSSEELDSFDAFSPIDLKDYMAKQRPWVEDEIYFLGIRLDHSPSDSEIAQHILNQRHSQRFRAYYSLRYPERVETVAR